MFLRAKDTSEKIAKREAKKNAKKGSAESLSLIIDIESGLVRGALVVNSPGVAPRIMFTTSYLINQRKIHFTAAKSAPGSEVNILDAMAKALKEVAGTIANKAIPDLRAKGITLPISKLHCALSTPWVISKTKTVKVNYEKDVEVTKDLVNKIIDTEHQELEEQFREDHEASSGGAALEYDLVFIEQKIFEIKLNGYAVTHVYGKHARELEVSFAVTVSSKDILARIHDALSGTLNSVSIRGIYGVNGQYVDEYHSSLLLQYAAFRNLINVREDYIAAHVHNDLSDIIVVRRGVCSVLASFPFGMSSFIKKTSHAFNQPETLTHSALKMGAADKLTSESKQDVADASDPIIREWATQFYQTLSLTGDAEALPRMLVLTVHDHFPYFEKALKSEDRGSKLDVTALDEALLEKAVTYEHGEDTNALVSMYAFALDAAKSDSKV